jgi:methylenetetrahydrofolate reductase (NADPH)
MASPPASPPAAASANGGERAAVMALVAGASLEMSPRERDAIAQAAEFLSPDTEVFISSPSAVSHHDIISAAVALRRRGFEPVPHIAARGLVGFTQLNDLLARASGEAGCRQALVIGGDLDPPAGPFHASGALLSLGLFEKHGFTGIALAAYPEGHPRIDDQALDRALGDKLALLRRAALDARVITQFTFDAAPVLPWLRAMQGREPFLPVRVGLAGPASIATLARYAVRCGIGHSIGALARHGTSIARLVTEAGPETVVGQLAAEDWRGLGVSGVHLFGFGGLTRTARWISAVTAGDFRIGADGVGFAVTV